MSRNLIASLTAFAAAAILAGPACAQERSAPVRHVSYADLNLSTDAGQRQFLSRVRMAAMEVCADVHHGRQDLNSHIAFEACRKNAVAKALEAVAATRQTVAAR